MKRPSSRFGKKDKGHRSQEREKDARRVKGVLRELRGSGEVIPDHGAAQRIMRKAYGRKAPCVYCGDRGTTADHVVPKSKGGQLEPANLVPACHDCNRAKGATMPREWFGQHPEQAARFLATALHVHEHIQMTVRRIATQHADHMARERVADPDSTPPVTA